MKATELVECLNEKLRQARCGHMCLTEARYRETDTFLSAKCGDQVGLTITRDPTEDRIVGVAFLDTTTDASVRCLLYIVALIETVVTKDLIESNRLLEELKVYDPAMAISSQIKCHGWELQLDTSRHTGIYFTIHRAGEEDGKR